MEDLSKLKLDDDSEKLKVKTTKTKSRRSMGFGAMLLTFIVGCAAGIAGIKFLVKTDDSIEVETDIAVLSSGDRPIISRQESGWIEVPDDKYPLYISSLVSGRLEEVNIRKGMEVKKGMEIAVVYDRYLKEELNKAEQDLNKAAAMHNKLKNGFRVQEVEQAKAQVDQAKANVNKLKAELKKMNAGYRKQEIDKAQANVNKYKALLNKSKANLEMLKAKIDESKANMDLEKLAWERAKPLLKNEDITGLELDELRLKYEQAKAQLNAKVAEKDEASAELDVAKSELANAEHNLSLMVEGYRKEDIEAVAAQVDLANAELAQAEQDLNLKIEGYRKEDIDAAKAEVGMLTTLYDLARLRYENRIIICKWDGVILNQYKHSGDIVNYPGGEKLSSIIASVYNPKELQARIQVDLNRVRDIFVKQKVIITTDIQGLNVTYYGEVIRFDPEADYKNNVVWVKVKILNPSEKLHPEMVCKAQFLAETQTKKLKSGDKDKIVLIPESAIIVRGGRNFVYKVEDAKAKLTAVELGGKVGGKVVVKKGLEGGEDIIVSKLQDLSDGVKIKLKGVNR